MIRNVSYNTCIMYQALHIMSCVSCNTCIIRICHVYHIICIWQTKRHDILYDIITNIYDIIYKHDRHYISYDTLHIIWYHIQTRQALHIIWDTTYSMISYTKCALSVGWQTKRLSHVYNMYNVYHLIRMSLQTKVPVIWYVYHYIYHICV